MPAAAQRCRNVARSHSLSMTSSEPMQASTACANVVEPSCVLRASSSWMAHAAVTDLEPPRR